MPNIFHLFYLEIFLGDREDEFSVLEAATQVKNLWTNCKICEKVAFPTTTDKN